MRNRRSAVSAFLCPVRSEPVKCDIVPGLSRSRIRTSVRMSFHRVVHLFQKIVDEQKFQFHTGIIDRDRQVICDMMTERADRTVVFRPYPFSRKIREPIYQNRHASLGFILKKQFLARFFAEAVFRRPEPSRKRRLYGRTQHHRRLAFMLLQCLKQHA